MTANDPHRHHRRRLRRHRRHAAARLDRLRARPHRQGREAVGPAGPDEFVLARRGARGSAATGRPWVLHALGVEPVLKDYIADLKEELEDAEERLKEVEKSPER